MSEGDACPLPTDTTADEQTVIRRMLRARRIAVVGLSDDPMRASFGVASYMQAHGYEIIPVNPNHATVLGQKCYASLADVPGPVELVNVFRRPEYCGDVARDAVAIGAGGIWLQSGIFSEEAARVAHLAKMPFVQNRCIMVEHMRQG